MFEGDALCDSRRIFLTVSDRGFLKAAGRKHYLPFHCNDLLVITQNIIILIVIKTIIALMSQSRVYSGMSCSEIDVN